MSLKPPKIIPGLDFTEREIAQARQRDHVLSMDLEITAACNGRCIYCYRYEEPGPQTQSDNELTFDEIKRVLVDGYRNHGLRRLCILGGEPLLPHVRGKYMRTLGLCNDLGIKHVTFTNGICLSRDLAGQLRDLHASICIKLNGISRETHDYLVNRPGSFDRVMEAFRTLLDIGYGEEDDDHLLAFETVVTKQNLAEIESMWVWARQNGIVPYVEKLTIQGRARLDKSLPVSNENLEHLFRRLNYIDRTQYGIDWDITPPIAGYHCARWLISLTVCETGKVKPCVGVDFYLGDIRHSSLREILASPLTQVTRNVDKHLKGRCDSCDLKGRCYGCRGAAYQTYGDFLEQDPNCWRKRKEEKWDPR